VQRTGNICSKNAKGDVGKVQRTDNICRFGQTKNPQGAAHRNISQYSKP